MKADIIKKLNKIEQNKDIHIVFASESGSRGWEFPSINSDYDVRFIYVQKKNAYLSIDEKIDTINLPINEHLDINGWDIRKALQHIRKSGAAIFEWLQSPIIYKERDGFQEELWELSQEYFSARALVNHYIGIAKNTYQTDFGGEKVQIKKLFYVLRPLLAAKWAIEKKSIPPMSINELLPLLTPELQENIRNIILIKETAQEGQLIKINAELAEFIKVEFKKCQEAGNLLPRIQFTSNRLNDFFISQLIDY